MKFNMKNFPEVPLCRTEKDREKVVVSMIKWRFGFEKELREKLAGLGDTTIRSMHDNVKGKIAAQNQKEIIEEVLGVEQKIKEEMKR
jgi:hypothetical protein